MDQIGSIPRAYHRDQSFQEHRLVVARDARVEWAAAGGGAAADIEARVELGEGVEHVLAEVVAEGQRHAAAGQIEEAASHQRLEPGLLVRVARIHIRNDPGADVAERIDGIGRWPVHRALASEERGIRVARAANLGLQRLAGRLRLSELAGDYGVGDAVAVHAVAVVGVPHVDAGRIALLPGQAVLGVPRPIANGSFEAQVGEHIVLFRLEGTRGLIDRQARQADSSTEWVEGTVRVQRPASVVQAVVRTGILDPQSQIRMQDQGIGEVLVDTDMDHAIGLFRRQAESHLGLFAPVLFTERVDAVQVVGVAETQRQRQVVVTRRASLVVRAQRPVLGIGK